MTPLRSYWQATAPAVDFAAAPDGPRRFDVAIVGGGFTGQWTAHHLLKARPDLSVALFEQGDIGFGASGRNGGFAMTKLGMGFADLEHRLGAPTAKALISLMKAKIHEFVAAIRTEAIECDLDFSGLLIVATNEAQAKKNRKEVAAAERLGIESIVHLGKEALGARVRSPTYVEGRYEPECALVHPMKLVRGLADANRRRGMRLFERTPVNEVARVADGVVLRTPIGEFRADRCVLAKNAWAGASPEFRDTILPMYTYIIATEPLPDHVWSDIGWDGFEGIEDSRVHLHFYRRTRDGRILWGGNDNIVPIGGRITPSLDYSRPTFQSLKQTFAQTFPTLRNVKFEYEWGGPFALTPNFLPQIGVLDGGCTYYAHGYSGHGVAPSFACAEVLRDMILDRQSEARSLLTGDLAAARFPAEPLRSIGARITNMEIRWLDYSQEVGKGYADEPMLLRTASRVMRTMYRWATRGGAET